MTPTRHAAAPEDVPAAIARRFPELAPGGDAALDEFLAAGRIVTLPAGQPVFHAGDACRAYLLVIEGRVPVRLVSEGGREITLYEVASGDSCVLTTACLLGDRAYNADAVAATEVRAAVFERAAFARAMERSATLRRFVFANLSQRLGTLIARVDDVAFGDIDRRLARALLGDAAGAGTDDVRRTHEQLATEAGTAREVVSRHLKRFEAQGWVGLARGRIRIRDRAALRRLAAV
jgi:CRP/FNR family transcriptional regulator